MSDTIVYTHSEKIKEKLARLPKEPGVYLLKDGKGDTIYVGKATSLASRVRQYFVGFSDSRPSIPYLRAQTEDIDWIVTKNEFDALILENNLIKKEKPKYNVRLRDDKTYISLKLTVNHPFPRIHEERDYKPDGSMYFGPYSSATALRDTLRTIGGIFKLRRCSDHELETTEKPCLYYHIGACSAPCVGYVDQAEYARQVDSVVLFLQGKDKKLVDDLKARMREAARNLRFEEASRYRDQITAVERTVSEQKVVARKYVDFDAVGFFRLSDVTEFSIISVRKGVLAGAFDFTIQNPLSEEDVASQFIQQYYERGAYVPPEIVVPWELEDKSIIETWLMQRRKAQLTSGQKRLKVALVVPTRGERKKMLELAFENAKESLRKKNDRKLQNEKLLESLRSALYLSALPERIECFDISHFQGSATVGSMVVFEGAQPAKKEYRMYSIKSHDTNDDFASMEEVLTRRLERGIREENLPDLIIIDGGKGQLSRVQSVFERLGVQAYKDVGLISLAKSRLRTKKGVSLRTDERVYKPDRALPIVLGQSSAELLLIARIRDEAHRFAITYHRKKRKNIVFETGLEGIPGLGEKRRKVLLDKYATLDKIKALSLGELESIDGIPKTLAKTIFEHLRSDAD
ncbi:MAG: excinuclease ABC subunit UvrC [Planctomycetes bacterium]|nr:excinuclease ABC subunit UvrC [Planctomycetota bacterium]